MSFETDSASAYARLRNGIGQVLLGKGLRARVFRGGAWLGAGSLAEQSARFARNLILVRLLAPSAFGTMAIVLSAASVLQAFTEIGVREALVQNPRGSERQYVNAAWWITFARAASTYFLLFLAAPWIARFYGNPELSALLRVATFSLLLEGAMSADAYVKLKQMNYAKWASITHGGGIAGVLITVGLSFLLRDVWALVLGACAEEAARCALSYVICPFLPSLVWDRAVLKELLRFSRGLFGLSFLNLVFARADVFVLAKLLSVTELGLYTMAVYLIQVPAGFVINLLGQILVPTFSEIQGDAARTNRIVMQVSTIVMMAGVPAIVFLFFCGRPLLALIYGRPYAAASASLIAASWVALINVLNGPITGVFYAAGRPELHRRCVAVMAAGMILFTYPLAKHFGAVGGQFACLLAILAGFFLQIERIGRLKAFHVAHYGKTFLLSAAASAPVVVVCMAGAKIISADRPFFIVLSGAIACFLAYGIATAFFWTRQSNPLTASIPEGTCRRGRLRETKA